MYGHGLFGDYTEVHTGNVRQLGTENGVLTCATDWIGMSEDDVGPVAIPALLDLSNFSPLTDRLQQGFLNFMYLGRLLTQPDGLVSDPAFQFSGNPVLDPSQVFYYGNSQGGIAGGALTAVEPDVTRSVLYVPGMNYSLLLTRSVDFEDYALILYPSYPDEGQRPLLLSLIQSLWDRGEPSGYANHMTTDPLPDTPPHKVLIEMSYGDHQVANVATEAEARTIGAPLRQPALDLNRLPAGFEQPFFDLPTLGDLAGEAANGSGMFVWDIGPKREEGGEIFGTDPPPITNTAPNDSFGVDPHDTVIEESPLIRAQIANFIKPGGTITDPVRHAPVLRRGLDGRALARRRLGEPDAVGLGHHGREAAAARCQLAAADAAGERQAAVLVPDAAGVVAGAVAPVIAAAARVASVAAARPPAMVTPTAVAAARLPVALASALRPVGSRARRPARRRGWGRRLGRRRRLRRWQRGRHRDAGDRAADRVDDLRRLAPAGSRSGSTRGAGGCRGRGSRRRRSQPSGTAAGDGSGAARPSARAS